MIKVKAGGFNFNLPQRWEDLTHKQAQRLSAVGDEDYHKALSAVSGVPGPEYIRMNPGALFSLYEIVSFTEEWPELAPNANIREEPVEWVLGWTFAQFELVRKQLITHPQFPARAMGEIAAILERQGHWMEAGVKAAEGIYKVIEHYNQFETFSASEPTDTEYAAGIETLQAFGSYPVLERIAEKYGKLPAEIAEQTAGWVLKEFTYSMEREHYLERYQKITKA